MKKETFGYCLMIMFEPKGEVITVTPLTIWGAFSNVGGMISLIGTLFAFIQIFHIYMKNKEMQQFTSANIDETDGVSKEEAMDVIYSYEQILRLTKRVKRIEKELELSDMSDLVDEKTK